MKNFLPPEKIKYNKTIMQSKKYSSRQRERSRIAHINQLFSLNPVLKIRLTISIADSGGGKEELYTLIFMQHQRHGVRAVRDSIRINTFSSIAR